MLDAVDFSSCPEEACSVRMLSQAPCESDVWRRALVFERMIRWSIYCGGMVFQISYEVVWPTKDSRHFLSKKVAKVVPVVL